MKEMAERMVDLLKGIAGMLEENPGLAGEVFVEVACTGCQHLEDEELGFCDPPYLHCTPELFLDILEKVACELKARRGG